MSEANQIKSQEDNLKKVIGLGEAMGISIGQIIGAGIMALTGIGIGLTGGSVPFAFVLASLLTIVTMMPTAIMGATIPTTGGLYRYTSRLLSPRMGFFYLLLFLIGQVTLAMYAISFAEYMQSLIPSIPFKLVALGLLTLLYVFNLIGVNVAAKIQGIMVIVLCVSLLAFIIGGFPKVNFDVFHGTSLFTGGIRGFLTATALLSFATGGAQVIAELGGEMKNPSRDIPLTIITTTIGVGVLYAFMSTIAVGVLPIDQVANKPLTDVAREVLSKPVFLFFIIGGAMTALATTLNATLSWVTKGMLIACEDGWLPKKLGEVNEKYGTPHWLLTIFYIVGALPIITGLSLEFVSMLGTGLILFTNIIPVIASTQLPKKYPDLYQKSRFKISPRGLKVLAIIATLFLGIQGYFLLSDLPRNVLIIVALYIIIAYLYCYIAGNKKDITFINEF